MPRPSLSVFFLPKIHSKESKWIFASPRRSIVFQELLKKLAQSFNQASIPYMVIGGQAVLIYGEPRLTRDIDVTLGVGVEDFAKVKDAIGGLGLTALKDDESFVRRTMVFPLRDDISGIRVDLVFSFSPYERDAIQRAREVDIDGVTVRYASLEDVIIHKIVAGRPRDLEDVKSMLLKNPAFNEPFIVSWLEQFDAALDRNGIQVFAELVREMRG